MNEHRTYAVASFNLDAAIDGLTSAESRSSVVALVSPEAWQDLRALHGKVFVYNN